MISVHFQGNPFNIMVIQVYALTSNDEEVEVGLNKNRNNSIPVELFQIRKDDAVKVLHSTCQQSWKTAGAPGLEKVSFHSNPKERQCQRVLKLLHHCTHLTR